MESFTSEIILVQRKDGGIATHQKKKMYSQTGTVKS